MYIFDEATSNLDSFSEQKIQSLLFDSIQDKTMIIIAHRLSTIMSCDKICFLENGNIMEFGTHDELMQLNGKYAQMIELQGMGDFKVNKKKNISVTEEEVSYG